MPSDLLALSQASEWKKISKQREARRVKLQELVETKHIDKFGKVDSFVDPTLPRKVALVKTLAGGHDYLGIQEGLVDIIGRFFLL